MKFDLFVLPFISGLIFVIIYVVIKFTSWILALNNENKKKLKSYFFSKALFSSVKEIFNESLLHRKIFKTNSKLGYMHMSLAFGWFLLIVIGNMEIKFYSGYKINPPYVPIFLRFFEPTPLPHFFGRGFNFIMDLILLMILTGIGFAVLKRFNSVTFGLKRTTVHNRFDKIALTSLWFIFPLRLIAESFTSGIYNNGSFLTGTLGHAFASFLPVKYLVYPAWWAYSIALGSFFFALPFSRYMHIPSEILLIIFRNAGLTATKKINSYSQAEISSCSRCGLCIDACQLATLKEITDIQPTYFIRDLRYGNLNTKTIENCLMCGRCNHACPVGINSTELRLSKRIEENNSLASNFNFIHSQQTEKTEVLFFAGCMTHLTPAIKKSMTEILDKSAVKWSFLDKDTTICCGRPLLLSGQMESARALMDKNKNAIECSGAKTLVTSCPICYKAFKEEYNLDIEVLHHSQYLMKLIDEEKIVVKKSGQIVTYHDPCELGRGSKVFFEPRAVISRIAELTNTDFEYEKGLCCGGSMGNILLSDQDRKFIANNALESLGIENDSTLITSCPLCKKTFGTVASVPVLDIAQLVAANLVEPFKEHKISAREFVVSEVKEKK